MVGCLTIADEPVRAGKQAILLKNAILEDVGEMKLHKDYEKYINHSKEEALQLIADLAYGYDGYNTIDSLKYLIDKLRAIALLGLKQNSQNKSEEELTPEEETLLIKQAIKKIIGD